MGLSFYFITGPARRRRPTRRISSRSRLLLLRTPSSFEWVIDFPLLLSLAIVAPACQDNVTVRLAWMSMKFDRRICNNCSIVIQLEAEVPADGRIWDEVVRKPEVLNPEATTSFRFSRFHWMAINRQRIRRGLPLAWMCDFWYILGECYEEQECELAERVLFYLWFSSIERQQRLFSLFTAQMIGIHWARWPFPPKGLTSLEWGHIHNWETGGGPERREKGLSCLSLSATLHGTVCCESSVYNRLLAGWIPICRHRHC